MVTHKAVKKNINFKHSLELTTEKYLRKGFINIILFELCEHCQENMPSLPQGAFAACKVSAQMRKPDEKSTYGDTKLGYTPVKYNGKFMNAIWGHYNRYSPHNIKSNECDLKFGTQNKQQQ